MKIPLLVLLILVLIAAFCSKDSEDNEATSININVKNIQDKNQL